MRFIRTVATVVGGALLAAGLITPAASATTSAAPVPSAITTSVPAVVFVDPACRKVKVANRVAKPCATTNDVGDVEAEVKLRKLAKANKRVTKAKLGIAIQRLTQEGWVTTKKIVKRARRPWNRTSPTYFRAYEPWSGKHLGDLARVRVWGYLVLEGGKVVKFSTSTPMVNSG